MYLKILSCRNNRSRSRSSEVCLHSLNYLFSPVPVVIVIFVLMLLTTFEVDAIAVKRKISKVHPVLIVISFDGFRFNYFDRTETPNLDILKTNGVSVAYMRNQFVTKTFPNHMSIATGLHVESHGVVDNSVFDTVYNQTLGPSSQLFWNPDNKTLPLWTLNELAGEGRRSGVMMWPGSNFAYGPNMKMPSRWKSWNESEGFENRVDEVIEWITDESEPVNLVFMYFEEPDEYAHAYGPESHVVTQFIQKLDNTTGYLINKLKSFGIFDDVNLILLSDHGFQEIKQQNLINVSNIVSKELYDQYGSTPVLHILPKQEKFEQVYNAFKTASVGNNYTVYRKENMSDSWHYTKNRRIMPIVLVADIGFVFDDFANTIQYYNTKFNLTPSFERVYGVHGYDNRLLPMHPFFLSFGPLFKSHYVATPFDNVDLFPLISKIMGFTAPPNNGSLKEVEALLKGNTYSLKPISLGWIIGTGVLIGIVILLGIMSLLISSTGSIRRLDFKRTLNETAEYRFLNKKEREPSHEERDGFISVTIRSTSQEEREALLMDSSTEEI